MWLLCFSLHSDVKSKLRNNLTVAQVGAVLRIKELVGPDRVVESYQEFDHQVADDPLTVTLV